MPEVILKQRPVPGCDSLIPPEPLQTLTTDFKPISVDLSKYEKFGSNINFDYYRLRND